MSHDRSFLENVATDIIHLHSRHLEYYKGDYAIFLKTKDEKLKNQQKEYEAQKMFIDHTMVSQTERSVLLMKCYFS